MITMRATRSGIRCANASPTAPQSCTTKTARARTPRSSRKRSMKRSYSSIVAVSVPGLPERPKPGRSGASPPLRSRKGAMIHSSELLGTPCRYNGVASPAPAGGSALRQNSGSPSISPLWSLTSGTARGYRPEGRRIRCCGEPRRAPQRACPPGALGVECAASCARAAGARAPARGLRHARCCSRTGTRSPS